MPVTVGTPKNYPKKRRNVFLQEITNCRIEAGLTQKDASELAKLSRNHIDKIERGENSPSVHTLDRLLHAYGYELEIVPIGKPT